MRFVRCRRWPAALVLMLLPARPLAADQRRPSSPVSAPTAIGPFAAGRMGVELGAAGLTELWSFNDSREWLAGGSAGVWWAFTEGRALIVQFHAVEIVQRTPRHAFLNGIVPTIRWRIARGPRLETFAELGLGVSWSDTRVPPGGTRFNYLAETALGVTRRVGRQTHAILGVRLLHLSNNNREGRARNPDIEAIGGYAALSVGF